MVSTARSLVRFISQELAGLADPAKAGPMAAYMKTTMPFYGVQKPERIPVYRAMKKQFAPAGQKEYEECVLALWKLEHREEKYAALEYACMFPAFINSASLPLYERLVREGQWWDFVDVIAIALVGEALLKERKMLESEMERWVGDRDMWVRRSAVLSQNRHKEKTKEKVLFQHCLRLCSEEQFFIRKAIGWALREYSYTAPEAVMEFLKQNREKLSGLSYREGAKALNRAGRKL